MEHTDVCIVGAGPAGSVAAMFLAKKGIHCFLVDKAKFPREKICGDGISGWVVSILNELDPGIIRRFADTPMQLSAWGIKIIAPNSKALCIPFKEKKPFDETISPGFISKRIDFDNFLINEVKKHPEIKFIEELALENYERKDNRIILSDKKKNIKISAKIVIFANGANSVFSKDPGGILKEKNHYAVGLRAYYKGITGIHPQNYIELHFFKNFLPGYFWIFPLPNGIANVGVGLQLDKISKKKINLKTQMLNSIKNIPHLRERFKDAELISKIQAYGLPTGTKKRRISGENFMLVGDAAGLVDPASGEGIGNAMISAKFAAIHAEKCLNENNFSKEFMQQYDRNLYNKIWKELHLSKKIRNFMAVQFGY